MLIFIWGMVGIQECFYPRLGDPMEESCVGLDLQPLPQGKEEGVGKKQEQKYQQSNKKEDNVFTMKVLNVPIMQPHSNPHLIGVVQQSAEQCRNDSTKELSIGKEEERCQNCNWIGTKQSCNP